LLIGERDGRAQTRGKYAGQMRDQLPPAQPAVLEVVDHFDDLSLHGGSFTNFEILSRLGSTCVSQADLV
jgi:hypothetical protein